MTYHIRSSIIPAVKCHLSAIKDNTTWILGDGKSINFWNNKWLDKTLADILHIPDSVAKSLQATVSDFIINGHWSFPQALLDIVPNLPNIFKNIQLPLYVDCD